MNYSILWADDEIDLLKPLILFLENKGIAVSTVNSGLDAIDKVNQESFDLIFLDENMPGMSGLEVLVEIKKQKPNLPVVMITKSEEEEIMEGAIGSKISDYLIKPINPSQLLLSVKKIMERKKLEEMHTNSNYRQEFAELSLQYQNKLTAKQWAEIYNKLIFWELEIDLTENKSMAPILQDQKTEANKQFAKFIEQSYESWLNKPDADTPILSHLMMRKYVFPHIQEKNPLFFILIDNLRLDQWKILENLISYYFQPEKENSYYSILPTTTAYARNAIFAGIMPAEIQKKYPEKWINDMGDSTDEEGFNQYEEFFLNEQLSRLKIQAKTSYHKIIHQQHEKNLLDNFNNLLNNQLNVVVFNFVDMLSHARTDMSVIKQLSPDESAYRSLTASWFQHSALFEFLKRIYNKKGRVVITTDHGMIRVQNPVKIVGDKSTNTNLRYKHGKNLGYDQSNKIMVVKNPEAYFLPKINMSTSYVFSKEDSFLAYPNNYNHYVQHYKNTFQHGGISMEECIVPVVYLTPKK